MQSRKDYYSDKILQETDESKIEENEEAIKVLDADMAIATANQEAAQAQVTILKETYDNKVKLATFA